MSQVQPLLSLQHRLSLRTDDDHRTPQTHHIPLKRICDAYDSSRPSATLLLFHTTPLALIPSGTLLAALFRSRTALDLCLMFGHFHLRLRQVKYLPAFNPLCFLPFQRFPAMGALINFTLLDMVGLCDQLNLYPACPVYPPLLLRLRFHKLRGTGLSYPSLDRGFPLF